MGPVRGSLQDGNIVHFKIKKKTQLRKLMEAYCARQSLQMDQIRFLFDGNRLWDAQTPDELDMEDDDVIDAMLIDVSEHINLKVKGQVGCPPDAPPAPPAAPPAARRLPPAACAPVLRAWARARRAQAHVPRAWLPAGCLCTLQDEEEDAAEEAHGSLLRAPELADGPDPLSQAV